jgi:hypothetical protein
MLASRDGHAEALALLLANGANVNAALQVIQNIFLLKAMKSTESLLKIYPLAALTLHLNPGWVYFWSDRFTKWAH